MIIKIELELNDNIERAEAEELVCDLLGSASMGDLLNEHGLKDYWQSISIVEKPEDLEP